MNSRPDLAVEASGLVKAFGTTLAVDGVDLAVPAGTVYGVLGPNGAGKTTTIRMLATLIRPDSGTALVFGRDVVRDPDAVRARISLTGQYASLDEDLTGRENLVLLARLHGHARVAAAARADELLHVFALTDVAARQVKRYSGGLRRRLDIAASLIIAPDLLFLDEPTTGLDPRSRNHVWEVLRTLVTHGTTILLTTQYLDEADQLANRIAVIDRGTVIAEGTSGELKASVGTGALHLRLDDPADRPGAEQILARILNVPIYAAADPAALSARIPSGSGARGPGEQLASTLAELSRSNIAVTEFELAQPQLEEVFLALTGRPATANTADKENAA
jgi:ABC-2 type transport system ATP-binding protein